MSSKDKVLKKIHSADIDPILAEDFVELVRGVEYATMGYASSVKDNYMKKAFYQLADIVIEQGEEIRKLKRYVESQHGDGK